MSWSPVSETSLEEVNGFKSTFEQFSQQDNYGLTTLRPKNVKLDVDEDLYDQQTDVSMLSVDAKAELELKSYRRKLGYPCKKNGTRKWQGQDEDTEGVESEIASMLRLSGLEREPPPDYRPNSKTTSRTSIPLDKIPVAGVKDLFLTPDHFKFENPYVRTKPTPKPSVIEEDKNGNLGNNTNLGSVSTSSSDDGPTKIYKELSIGVAGAQYVTPAQLYAMKARRNR